MVNLIAQYYRFTKKHTPVAPPVEPEEPQEPVTLAAPSNLTATVVGRLVTMNWQPNAPGANQYADAREDGGAYKPLATLDDAADTLQFVASDAAATVDMRLKALGDGVSTLDSAYATASLVIKKQLAATQELSCTVDGKTLHITFQPDSRGMGQELRITNISTAVAVLVPLTIDDYAEVHEGEYATAYTIEHRTLGDGIDLLDSPWALISRTTGAAPAVVTPTVSFTSAYDETDPTKLKATYTVTLNPPPTEKTLVNIRRSNSSTGVAEELQFIYQAGQTTLSPVYNFVYASLNPNITEVVFEALPGTGYTLSGTTLATHALNYTPPAEETSMLATESLHIRDGVNAGTNYSASPYLELKTSATSGETRNAVIGWNASIANKPTTLKLYVENYATAKRGTIEVCAMTGGFDPAVDNWNTLIAKKGALLGIANFSPSSPYIDIELGSVTAAGEYSLMLIGRGYSSGVEYHISKPGSANPPTLAETVVPELVDIKTFGAIGTANDQSVFLSGVASTQASGKMLLIDTNDVVKLPLNTSITQNDVKIKQLGKIKANTPDVFANDWRRKGFVWSTVTTSPDYIARQNAYKSAYRMLSWSGRNGHLIGPGDVDGGFDNSALATWGAKLSDELMGVTGDGFTGDLRVNNAGGSAIEITSEGCIANIESYNAGYTGAKVTIGRDLNFVTVNFKGGKQSRSDYSRTPVFTVTGQGFVEQLNIPILHIENGGILFEGAVGNDHPLAGSTFYKNVDIGEFLISNSTEMHWENGDQSSYTLGKLENTGNVSIVRMVESTELEKMGSIWLDKLSGTLTIGERESDLPGFRPAGTTHIGRNTVSRHSSYTGAYVGWFNITKPVNMVIDEFVVENNGYGDMSSVFGIFDMFNQSPSIHVKAITNNGGAKIPLARFNSTTGSGSIRIGTGLTVTQQLSYLAARNIYVSTAAQRLLAAS